MNFTNINIDDIKINKSIKNSFDVLYNDSHLDIKTCDLYSPFKIERKFNDYFLNLQFRDYKKKKYIEEFLIFISKLEEKFIKELNINPHEFNSQIRESNSYDPILYTKFIFKNDKCLTEIQNTEEFLNIFNIKNNFYCNCILNIDKIWLKNNKFYYKIKLKHIFIN